MKKKLMLALVFSILVSCSVESENIIQTEQNKEMNKNA